MATKFTFRRVQTVTVQMLDEGEEYEGEPIHWESEKDQQEAAEEYADEIAEPVEWDLVNVEEVKDAD